MRQDSSYVASHNCTITFTMLFYSDLFTRTIGDSFIIVLAIDEWLEYWNIIKLTTIVM